MKINSSFRENNSEITPFIFFISMLYTFGCAVYQS